MLSMMAVLTLQDQCNPENNCLRFEDGGGCLLTETGKVLVARQRKECDYLAKIPLPMWIRSLTDR
jgi:hypothetical protein